MINHRYHILKKLGEGGSGQVFLVEDTLDQRRQSAMKILHRGDPSGAGESFRNEVSILATLSHPNLVHVLDFGVVRRADHESLEGRDFFTMEYLRGVSAEAWCRDLRSDDIRVLHLTSAVLQALDVLEYVHRQGIIHFDIKPENLLLIAAGDRGDDLPLVKLTDFGFSIKQSGLLEFSLRGTLEYTAPELLRGESFDHRSDLYSLGVTLYQLIENRCPFEAGDPVELIKKVLTAEPEFDHAASDVYARFVPLLQGLLQKSPSRRIPSAREAARVLLAGSERPAALGFDQAGAPGFVGREDEKTRIGHAIASLGPEHARASEAAILITGPEGIGKTAMLVEMARFARAAGIPVLETSTSQRDVPFGGVLSLLPFLRAEMLSRSPSGGEEGGISAGIMEPPVPARAGDQGESSAAWRLEREKSVETLARFILQASSLFPFIIIADDAELLDSESKDALRIVVRDGTPGRLLVLLTVGHEDGVTIAGTRIPLGELAPESVVAMSGATLFPAGVGEAIGRRLFQLYGGTPSILVEALYAAGAILRTRDIHEGADIAGLAEEIIGQLPRDLGRFLFARYASLDRGCQMLMEVLSCFAGPAQGEVIQAIVPFQRQRTTAALSLLESRGLITSHENGRRFAVRHETLKTLIRAEIQKDRAATHQFIASTLAQLPGDRSFADLQELAHHFGEAGQSAQAAQWLETAADEGMRLSAYQRARELYQQAMDLDAGDNHAASTGLGVKLALSLFHCGAFREAGGLARDLLGGERCDVRQRTSLHKIAGLSLTRLGDYEEGKAQILAALETCSDDRERVELAQEIVGVDIALGNYRAAEQASLSQLDRVAGLGDRPLLATIYTDLGIATFSQDLFDRSAGYFRESVKVYESLEQKARVADAIMNIGNVLSAKGDLAQAIEHWSTALTISQEHGTMNQQAQILNNLGIAHYKMKRFEEARSFYARARDFFERLESKQGSAFVLTNLGEVGFAEGQYERALLMWEAARKLYAAMDDGRGMTETMLQLAQVCLVLGDADSVLRHLDEAEAATDARDFEIFRPQLLYLRGMYAMVLRQFEAARAFFGKADECTHESGGGVHPLLIRVRMASCDHHMGMADPAARMARDALARGEREALSDVVAEACLLLGMIGRALPSAVPEKPIVFFSKGFDAMAKEPVAELTWKLALALGQEFAGRGQRERAKECFTKAKLILRFFAGQFTSFELENRYLAVENKRQTLVDIDAYLRT